MWSQRINVKKSIRHGYQTKSLYMYTDTITSKMGVGTDIFGMQFVMSICAHVYVFVQLNE